MILFPRKTRFLFNKKFSVHFNCISWGKDQFGKAGVYSVMLKKVPLPIVPHSTCQQKLRQTRLSQKFNLHSTFICAGGVPGTDTCEGDGGAPLHCLDNNNSGRFVQTGIVVSIGSISIINYESY